MQFKDRLSRILSGKKSLEKISQAKIARMIGVSPVSISDWKNGKSEPSIDTAQRYIHLANDAAEQIAKLPY